MVTFQTDEISVLWVNTGLTWFHLQEHSLINRVLMQERDTNPEEQVNGHLQHAMANLHWPRSASFGGSFPLLTIR